MRFSYRMVPEVYQLFWAAMARGEFITYAAVEAGTYRKQGTRWLVAGGWGSAAPWSTHRGAALPLPLAALRLPPLPADNADEENNSVAHSRLRIRTSHDRPSGA
jgi:hypothetical protein